MPALRIIFLIIALHTFSACSTQLWSSEPTSHDTPHDSANTHAGEASLRATAANTHEPSPTHESKHSAPPVAEFEIESDTQIPEVYSKYQIGDIVRQTIIAPESFSVNNPEKRTQTQQEIMRAIPLLYGYNTEAGRMVRKELITTWESTRQQFTDGLQAVFGKKILTPGETTHFMFGEFRIAFNAKNKEFPIDDVLATRWAQGDSATDLLKQFSQELEIFMSSNYIRPDEEAQAVNAGFGRITLVPVKSLDETPSEDEIVEAKKQVDHSRFIPLKDARRVFLKRYTHNYLAISHFLSDLIRPNTYFLEEATNKRWRRAYENLADKISYEKGDVVVSKGGKVTPVIKDALDRVALLNHFKQAGIAYDSDDQNDHSPLASGYTNTNDHTASAFDSIPESLDTEIALRHHSPKAAPPINVSRWSIVKQLIVFEVMGLTDLLNLIITTIGGLSLSGFLLLYLLIFRKRRKEIKKAKKQKKRQKNPPKAHRSPWMLIKGLFHRRPVKATIAAPASQELHTEILNRLKLYEDKIQALENKLHDKQSHTTPEAVSATLGAHQYLDEEEDSPLPFADLDEANEPPEVMAEAEVEAANKEPEIQEAPQESKTPIDPEEEQPLTPLQEKPESLEDITEDPLAPLEAENTLEPLEAGDALEPLETGYNLDPLEETEDSLEPLEPIEDALEPLEAEEELLEPLEAELSLEPLEEPEDTVGIASSPLPEMNDHSVEDSPMSPDDISAMISTGEETLPPLEEESASSTEEALTAEAEELESLEPLEPLESLEEESTPDASEDKTLSSAEADKSDEATESTLSQTAPEDADAEALHSIDDAEVEELSPVESQNEKAETEEKNKDEANKPADEKAEADSKKKDTAKKVVFSPDALLSEIMGSGK